MSASTEEKTPSTLLQPLSGKALREAKVTEALAFMPSALLALINVYDKSLDEETNLLTHAMRGEQEQAEAMLTINPDLALEKGSITDLSNRTFRHHCLPIRPLGFGLAPMEDATQIHALRSRSHAIARTRRLRYSLRQAF